jgi:N-acetylmuramoyl-L-alanine amidase
MIDLRQRCHGSLIVLALFAVVGCKGKESATKSQDPPDLNAQIRPYVTIENTKVRTGPGLQFRAVADIPRNAKVQVVGRDGEWVLIVSKKGNAPGYIEMASVQPGTGEESESPAPAEARKVEGKYETVVDTQVRSGPGPQHSVLAQVKKGTKLNVVNEESGWLKVESKSGKPPGYVDASLARPVENRQSVER